MYVFIASVLDVFDASVDDKVLSFNILASKAVVMFACEIDCARSLT
jgi:hypothetical protein